MIGNVLIYVVEFYQLVMDTRNTQSEAFAPGTWENLLTQWVKFLLFFLKFNLRAFPADDVVLAWYAQHLSYGFKSHASVVSNHYTYC